MSFLGYLFVFYAAGALGAYVKDMQNPSFPQALQWPISAYHWARDKLNDFRDL